MLRIHAQTSVDAAKSYYTEGLAREDYYSQGQEIAGCWHGHGAERLGLSGEVTKDAFAALCENQNPTTGERLTERTKTNRRVGYDFNYHVPKSVSAVYSQTRDDRIMTAFRSAVAETMRARMDNIDQLTISELGSAFGVHGGPGTLVVAVQPARAIPAPKR